jgi:hypothetical protein
MTCANGRVIHNADSHVMETRDWLDGFIEPGFIGKLQPVLGEQPGRVDRLEAQAKLRKTSRNRRTRVWHRKHAFTGRRAEAETMSSVREPCHPARPISVLAFRGTDDPIVPYAGGASMPPNGLQVTIHFLGAMGTFQKWSQLNGCTGMSTDAGAGCQTYSQCKDGVEVTWCTNQGGSHEPGDAELGWSFMKKHPLP